MKALQFSNKPSKLAGIILMIGGLAWQTPASASTLQIDFSNLGAFSGTPPSVLDPSSVYARAVFDDGGSTGTVTLTMSVLSGILPAGSYVNDWYLNSDPSLGALTVAFASGTAAQTFSIGTNAFKADGTGGGFDLLFQFDTANPGQLGIGGTSVYTLTGTGITANSFNFLSVPDGGPTSGGYLGAIHVQGYGDVDGDGKDDSVWIGTRTPTPPCTVDCGDVPVPEPGMVALMGMGMLSMAVSYSRRRKFN